MALSGTISNSYNGYIVTTTWSANQNISGNYSDLTCHHTLHCTYDLYIGNRNNNCNVDGVIKDFTSPAISTSGNSDYDLGTTYHRIEHNVDGKKECNISTTFKIQATINSTYIDSITASGTIELNDIPRASTAEIRTNPVIVGETFYVKINTINKSFKYSLSLSFEDLIINFSGKSSAPNWSLRIPTSFYSRMVNTNRAEATLTCNTWNDDELIGTTTTKFMVNVADSNPVFSEENITYQDTNTSVTAITKNNQLIVQNKSNLKITFTPATGKNSATIKKYDFILNGVTKSSTSSGGTIDFGTINSSSNLELRAVATDSRGNQTSVSKTITILSYNSPKALVKLNRLNNYEDETYLTVDGDVSNVDAKNLMTIKYRYKLSGGSYNDFTTISDNVKQTLSLNKNDEYIFNVVVTDSFNEKFDKEFVLGKGVFPLFIDTEKNSVGINCLPSNEKCLEIIGNIVVNSQTLKDYILGVISEYMNKSN